MAEQAADTSQIRYIRRHFARVYRKTLETPFLRTLDFRVPVSALHQTHGHASAVGARGGRRPVDDVQRAFAVGLHGQPQARPLTSGGILGQRFDHVQRQIQTIRFFGVNGELHAQSGRPARQRPDLGD